MYYLCGLFQISGQSVPRFTGKTQITGKTTELRERPKNNREFREHSLIYEYNK